VRKENNMPLAVGGRGGRQDRLYVNRVEILKVDDLEGVVIFGEKEDKYDLAIDLSLYHLDAPKPFETTLTLRGNFVRDKDGTVIRWGGAVSIDDFLKAISVKGNLNDDETIPDKWLDAAEGQIIKVLSYPRNNSSYSGTWNRVWKNDTEDDFIRKQFLSEYRRSGYPRNYGLEQAEPKAEEQLTIPTPTTDSEELV
jgi:hypothetical protein|tara:strand:- start:6501 stop:7088 length:588 start_codon:yes stop_codon:yes gene_type:complete